MPLGKELRHGTRSRYTDRKCRCADCRKANREYAAEWEKRPGNRAKALAYHNKWRRKILSELKKYKESTPCADCGGKFPSYVMDFDHRPGEPRDMTHGWSMTRLLIDSSRRAREEIKKCDLVCANCHRIRTFGRGAFGKK